MRRALAKLLRQGHRSVEKRRYKPGNSNEGGNVSKRPRLFAFGGFGLFLVVVVAGHAVLRRARWGAFICRLVIREMPKEVPRTMFWQRCCKPANDEQPEVR